MKAKAQAGKGNPITPLQIKAIHAIKGALGMDDECYRAMLQDVAGATSSKNLSWQQAESVIDDLKRKAGQESWKKGRTDKYRNLDGRAGMATSAQLRKIEATWDEVSRATDPEQRAKALRAFIFRVAKVSDIRFLDRPGAGKIINALEAMSRKAKAQ